VLTELCTDGKFLLTLHTVRIAAADCRFEAEKVRRRIWNHQIVEMRERIKSAVLSGLHGVSHLLG
jgi:hypothetical protein